MTSSDKPKLKPTFEEAVTEALKDIVKFQHEPLTVHELTKLLLELRTKGYADSIVHGIIAFKGPEGKPSWGYGYNTAAVVVKEKIMKPDEDFVSVIPTPDQLDSKKV